MKRIFRSVYIIFIFLFAVEFFSGCDNTAEFLKRDKLTFLYKLNTNASVMREETFSVVNIKKAGYHIKKLSKTIKELDHFKPVENWETSEILLEEYRQILVFNLHDAEMLVKRNEDTESEIEPVTYEMKVRLDDFIRKLYKLTVEVGSD